MNPKTQVFLPGDPDAETGVPPFVMMNEGAAQRCADLRLTVGVRKDGGENLFAVMTTTGGQRVFAAFTAVTARAFGESLIEWAAKQEAQASSLLAACVARTRSTKGGQ